MWKNLTPHQITIMAEDGTPMILKPEATSARVSEKPRRIVASIDGVRQYSPPEYGDITGLPNSNDEDRVIVSLLVASAAKKAGRTADVFVVAETNRDAKGQIVSCNGVSCLE